MLEYSSVGHVTDAISRLGVDFSEPPTGTVCLEVCMTRGAQSRDSGPCACQIPDGPPNPRPHLVGYLGVYWNVDGAQRPGRSTSTR
jgi:hypothetical protein